MYKNNYLQKRRELIESILRLYVGVQELFYKPYYNLVIVTLIVLFCIVWKKRNDLFGIAFLPSVLVGITNQVVSICLILILILSILIFIKYLGYWTAKKDEEYILQAFEGQNENKGVSILISKRSVKIGDVVVTIREFYSLIPFERWKKQQEAIEDMLNITLVSPYIERGGRNKNKGKRIVLYSVPNRVLMERGALYDD